MATSADFLFEPKDMDRLRRQLRSAARKGKHQHPMTIIAAAAALIAEVVAGAPPHLRSAVALSARELVDTAIKTEIEFAESDEAGPKH